MGILCNLMSTNGENLICATLNEMYRNPYFHISSCIQIFVIAYTMSEMGTIQRVDVAGTLPTQPDV